MATQITNYQCPSCTGPLRYDEAGGKLACDFCGSSYAVFDLSDSTPLCSGDIQFIEQIFKCVTVFRLVDGRAISADDLNTPVKQRLCQVNCGLTTQRSDNTIRFFKLDDIHNIFRGQRLKVQFISGGVVG